MVMRFTGLDWFPFANNDIENKSRAEKRLEIAGEGLQNTEIQQG